ncbi:MAG: haloacid dehalogenase, partial [Chthonomonadales bacterium]
MAHLEDIAAEIRHELERENSAREIALRECREVIRIASKTIRAVHRLELEAAIVLLVEGRRKTLAVRELLDDHPQIYHAGYVHDSQKEYVEAAMMIAIVSGEPLPTPAQLEVEYPAYLNGLAEAGSESRRYVLDRLRAG